MSRVVQSGNDVFSISASDYGLTAPIQTTIKCDACQQKYKVTDINTHYSNDIGLHISYLYKQLKDEREARQLLQQQFSSLQATMRHIQHDTVPSQPIQQSSNNNHSINNSHHNTNNQSHSNNHNRHRNNPASNKGNYIQQRQQAFADTSLSRQSHTRSHSLSPGRSIRRDPSPPPPVTQLPTSNDEVIKQLKSNLNKLTNRNFDRLAQKIVDTMNYCIQLKLYPTTNISESGETNKEPAISNSTQILVTQIYEKSLLDSFFATLYAKLCKYIVDHITVDTTQPSFKKILLNQCGNEFNYGLQHINESNDMEKQRTLGCIRFISELYKYDLIVSSIIHACIQYMISLLPNANESHIQVLCDMLSTIGEKLDTTNETQMNTYFNELQQHLDATTSIISRSKFMLIDLIDLRKRNWKQRENKKQTSVAVTT